MTQVDRAHPEIQRKLPRPAFSLGGALFIVAICGGCSQNDTYPNRPIELICPWSAGGGTDRMARQLAHQLDRELGTPVNVINATGGNGVTGHTRGAMAKPDGYTLTMLTVELNMLHWRGLTNLGPQDFTPLCLLNRDAAAIFVRSDSPYATIDQLQSAIRTAPAPLKVSGTSQGAVWHAATIGWLEASRIPASQILWISIAGSAPSLQELLSGGVDFVCCSIAEAKSLMDAGKVRCLGEMSDETDGSVPSFRDAGIDWSMAGWRGVAAPLGIDPQRKAVLCAALKKVCASEEFRHFMKQGEFHEDYADADTFAADLAVWDRSFGEILKSPAFASVRKPRFGPMFFPKLIGGALAVVFVLLLCTGGLRRSPAAAPIRGEALLRLAIVPGWILVYAFVSPIAGFLVTVGCLLLMTLWFLQVPLKFALFVSLLVVPATYQLFAVVLHVSLPWGWIGW